MMISKIILNIPLKKILKLLDKYFPDHQISGEEFGQKFSNSKYKWVIDPIDGTKALVCGQPTWSNLIGLLENDYPKMGLANFPILKKYYYSDTIIYYCCNIKKKIIRFSSEKNKKKIGKYTPGTNVKIISDEDFLKKKIDYAILLSWNYKKFFLSKSLFTNNGGKFIIPLPTPHIE